MSRAEQRFIISTTDDVVVTSTLNKIGENLLEVTDLSYIDADGISTLGKLTIPCDEVVSIVRESVISEDVTSEYITEKELVEA